MQYNLEELDSCRIKELIDYLHGLPRDLTIYIKTNINRPFMDPSIYNSNTRNLSNYTNIKKYINKNVNIVEVKPDQSDYQCEYSVINQDIDNIREPYGRILLRSILDAECYSIDTLRNLELYISKKELTDEMKRIITFKIFPYKLKAYDIYTNLVMPEFSCVNGNQLINTYNDIIQSINNNIDVFKKSVYRYFKLLNMESADMLSALNRFPITEWNIDDIKSDVEFLCYNGIGILDTYTNDDVHEIEYQESAENESVLGYVFNIDKIKLSDNDKVNIANKLKTLTKSINKRKYAFDIDDNSYGDLRYLDKKKGYFKDVKYVGVIYSNKNETYHIITYKDKPYLILLDIKSLKELEKEFRCIPLLDNSKDIYLGIANKNRYKVEIPY